MQIHRTDFQELELKGSLWSLMIDKAISEGKRSTRSWKEYAVSLERGSGDEDSASPERSPRNPEDGYSSDDWDV